MALKLYQKACDGGSEGSCARLRELGGEAPDAGLADPEARP